MQIQDGLDSVLFSAYYLRGKTEEEMQKIAHYLESKIKSLEKEVKLKWKYDSHQRAKKMCTLGGYRAYLVYTKVALDNASGEINEKPCEDDKPISLEDIDE